MSDPERLLRDPDLSEETRALLEAKAPPPPMPRETRLRVGSFIATMAAGTAAMSTALTGKVLAIAIAVSVTGATAWVATRDSDESHVDDVHQHGASTAGSKRARSGPPSMFVRDTPPPPITEPLSATDVDETAERSEPPRERRPARSASPATEDAPPAVLDPLAAEAAMLERARALLASDPAGALAETARHERDHPRGQLAEERELIAIDALRRLGRVPEAEARAHALIARSPNGMYAQRARRLIGVAGQPP